MGRSVSEAADRFPLLRRVVDGITACLSVTVKGHNVGGTVREPPINAISSRKPASSVFGTVHLVFCLQHARATLLSGGNFGDSEALHFTTVGNHINDPNNTSSHHL